MAQDTMRLRAPGKLNLYLDVGAVRPDGYHDVTSVYHALELADVVELSAADALSVTCEPGLDVPQAENIAYRAAESLGKVAGRRPDVSIRIEKHIPHAAGLGGGSADAAAVIAGLARWWDLEPAGAPAMRAAAAVGADVPFFLVGGAALFRGRGDRFVRTMPARSYDVVLVKVTEAGSTAEVYGVFDTIGREAAPGPSAVGMALRMDDRAALGEALFNGLAAAAQRVAPAMTEAIAWLDSCDGVLSAQVAGSGSCVFGLCTGAEAAAQAASEGAQRGWWTAATRLSPGAAAPIERDEER